jgi:TRAP-type C4-dicarboxylate transport system substrate-binding protein
MRRFLLPAALAAAGLVAAAFAPAALSQTRFDIAVFHPERDAFGDTMRWWMAEIQKRTGDRVQIRAHYAGSLAKLTETLDAVRNGVVPMGVTAPSVTSGTIPAMAYLEILGGFPSTAADIEKVLDAARPHIAKLFEAQGVVYLWQQPAVGGAVACRDKHLLTPADWKGVKVRTAGRWQAQQMQALGAVPVTIDPGEQYIALQNRTVDCALTINTLGLALKLHEVAPKVTQLRVPVNATMYVMNARSWASLSADDRKAIETVSQEAEKRALAHLVGIQEDAANKMKAAKADLKPLSDQDLKAFREAMRPVIARIDEAAGAAGKPLAELLRGYW